MLKEDACCQATPFPVIVMPENGNNTLFLIEIRLKDLRVQQDVSFQDVFFA